jgi:hypothetical protein
MKKSRNEKQMTEFPPEVTKADTIRPAYDSDQYLSYKEIQEMGLDSNELTFYFTPTLGWVLCTLGIAKAKHDRTARTYGVTLDRGLCRVGSGPHVKKTVTIYLSKENAKRLERYTELWLFGMEKAGCTRDRISSRRAQGQLERAAGKYNWMWDAK